MKLGMYSPEIKRFTTDRFFDAVKVYGFSQVQFDFQTVGEETMPEKISQDIARKIVECARDREIEITAVNGTFNMIHPDTEYRKEYIKRFEQIAFACEQFDCQVITLCTGTRNLESMWRWHDGNESVEAWNDLLNTTGQLINIADKYDVFLGVETEASNVVNTAEKARKLLDEFQSPRLRIIMDAANLFHKGKAYPDNALPILENAFKLLGKDIIAAHGKDIKMGPEIEFTSAGRGIVAFERFFELLNENDYHGGIILHGIHDEAEFPYCVSFINELLGRRDQ